MMSSLIERLLSTSVYYHILTDEFHSYNTPLCFSYSITPSAKPKRNGLNHKKEENVQVELNFPCS
jgi:hypothetical protein